jgi:PH (Pleckstrin Homology) domain-containing protein
MDVVIDVVHRTYRSASLLVLGVLGLVFVVGLAAWVLVDELSRGRWLVAVAAFLWGVVLAELVGEVFLRPRVTTTRQGVVLVNPFRTVVVPWEQIRGVETELALQIVVDGGRHSSFAATGNRRPSRGALLGGRRQPPGGEQSLDQLLKAGVAAGALTPPVECKLFIDAAMNEWRQRTGRRMQTLEEQWAALERPDGEPPALITWHRRWLLAFAVPTVLLVAVTLALHFTT